MDPNVQAWGQAGELVNTLLDMYMDKMMRVQAIMNGEGTGTKPLPDMGMMETILKELVMRKKDKF